MGILKEFKEFAVKGNAIDMAVGIILGAAFGKVVNSIVADLIMPPIGMLIGGVDFKNLQVILKQGQLAADGKMAGEVAIRYGMFINTAIEFLIVALSVFFVIKVMNRLIRKRDAKPAA
jgi:large conductance mechanosensitive channel